MGMRTLVVVAMGLGLCGACFNGADTMGDTEGNGGEGEGGDYEPMDYAPGEDEVEEEIYDDEPPQDYYPPLDGEQPTEPPVLVVIAPTTTAATTAIPLGPNGFNKCAFDTHTEALGGRHQKTLLKEGGQRLERHRGITTLDACCDVCFQVPDCGAVNLDLGNGYCYLKGKAENIPEQETPETRVTQSRPINKQTLMRVMMQLWYLR